PMCRATGRGRAHDPCTRRDARRRRALGMAVALVLAGTGGLAEDASPEGAAAAGVQPEGTRRMIERLGSLEEDIDPSVIMFVPDKAVAFFAAKMADAPTPEAALRFRIPYASSLLNSGRSEEA